MVSVRSLLTLALLLLCQLAAASARAPTQAQQYRLARCYRYCKRARKGTSCRKACLSKVIGGSSNGGSKKAQPQRVPQVLSRPQPGAGVRPQSVSTSAGSSGGAWFKPRSGGDGIIWGNYAQSGSRQGRQGRAYASYHYYGPRYETGNLYCADAFNAILPAAGKRLLEFPWVAYCWEGGPPMSTARCGSCAKITNPATGQSVKVTIVDQCGNKGVDMDPVAFNAIDGDGAGYRDGHMYVDIDFVAC